MTTVQPIQPAQPERTEQPAATDTGAAVGGPGRHRRPVSPRVRRGTIAITTALTFAAVGLVATGASVTSHAVHETHRAEPAPPTAHPFTLAPSQAAQAAHEPIPAQARDLTTRPGRVYVPSLRIDARWTQVAFSFTTGLDVPTDVHTIGLSRQGGQLDQPATGSGDAAAGTVLMAGHVNYAGQGAGSFQPLARVRPGAAVITTDTTGTATSWVVVSLAAVVKRNLPHSLFTAAGPRQLVLITCGGALHHGNYDDNIVATAIPAAIAVGSSTAGTHAPTPAATTGAQHPAASVQAGAR